MRATVRKSNGRIVRGDMSVRRRERAGGEALLLRRGRMMGRKKQTKTKKNYMGKAVRGLRETKTMAGGSFGTDEGY